MAVGIFMHPHARLDVVMAVAVGWDLQAQALVAHGVVIADDALLLNAQDVASEPAKGTKALAASAAGVAKRALCAGQNTSSRNRLASSMACP